MSLAEWTKFAPKPKDLVGADEWNVFLSYRSVDRTWVLNLYDVLRQHDFKVFLDQCVLKAGDRLRTALEDALGHSQAGVMVWSKHTRDSEWVRDEYVTLEELTKTKTGFVFVPVTLDDTNLPVFARNRIYINFSSYPDGPNGGELLRLLHALAGKPLSEEAVVFADKQDTASKAAVNKIDAAIDTADGDYLEELFDAGGLAWETSSALGCKAAEGLIDLGQPDRAISMLERLQDKFPGAVRPKQLYALARAKRAGDGDLTAAQRILGELYRAGERDPETVGIYARTWMDRYVQSGDEDDLRKSRDLYVEAFETARDYYYVGINAAAKSILIGEPKDLEKAADYAARVQKIVGTEKCDGDYWRTATVAETYLMQRNYGDAARLYGEAIKIARSKKGSHESTWKQACRLMEKLKPSDAERALVRGRFKKLPDCDPA